MPASRFTRRGFASSGPVTATQTLANEPSPIEVGTGVELHETENRRHQASVPRARQRWACNS